MERIRVGVVGTGGIFMGTHLPAYARLPEAQLVALCDIDQTRLRNAQEAAKRIYLEEAKRAGEAGNPIRAEQIKADLQNLQSYPNLDAMLKAGGIDLVDICTMPDTHAPLAISAMRKGIHITCEKPMARTWLECMEIVEAVEETGKFYQHGENWLYLPTWYNAKKLIDAGELGELQLMFLATAHGGPEWSTKFWEPLTSGGGALLDNGVHAVTAAWFLAGFHTKPTKVKAAKPHGLTIRMPKRIIEGQYRDVVVDDDAHILIQFENAQTGAWTTAHVEGSWSNRDSFDTVIVGTNGKIQFTYRNQQEFLILTDPFEHKREMQLHDPSGFYTWVGSFHGELRNICNCIINNTKPFCDEHIGAESSAIVGAAYLSQRESMKAITLDEFKAFANEIKRKHKQKAAETLITELIKGLK